MKLQDSEEAEASIRAHCSEGRLREGATCAIRAYGPQILGFLVAMHRNEDDGGEAFAMFSEDLWRGLGGFAWQCSFRTWAYTVARHASARLGAGKRLRRERHLGLSDCPELAQITDAVRTETLSYLRTETKSKLAAIRDGLPADDKALLILRVDRQLAWNDLAHVLLPAGDPPTAAALKREAARLRKRYQLVKQRLLEQLAAQ